MGFDALDRKFVPRAASGAFEQMDSRFKAEPPRPQCQWCNGSGKMNDDTEPCSICAGTGIGPDFHCATCGKETAVAPSHGSRGLCEECCGATEDGHDFQYERFEQDYPCTHCGALPPHDHYLYDPEP